MQRRRHQRTLAAWWIGALAVAIGAVAAIPALGGDWYQWRGPEHNGV